jgi:simple sugar transport system ATP-binding protein
MELKEINSSFDDEPVLQVNDIVVNYGSFVANDHINLDIHPGEIHALLGENGAGKTTLMKVLVGLLQPRSGKIFLEGKEVTIDSAITAQSIGIGMVHQHFMLIPTLTVAQNVCIGLRSAGYPFPDLRKVSSRIRELSERYNLRVDPNARVSQLSVGAQQRVEIIKALYRGARLLILDEPTAVLTPQETDGLFEVVNNLAQQNNSIIFISHKLNEVMTISHRITVLRQGKVVATRNTSETDVRELARLMVGHDLGNLGIRHNTVKTSAPPVVRIENLRYVDERKVECLQKIDLDIHEGEIHGIAGVDGNGQEELARILAGLYVPTSGKVWMADQDITHASPARRISTGMAYIPGDRQRTGLVLDMSVIENSILELNTHAPYSKNGFMNFSEINNLARNLVQSYDIRCRDLEQNVDTLSGGNQQKLVLARELYRNPRFIIAMQPTRGLDVGATEYVHTMLIEQQKRGSAILLISTELDEVLELSDRVSVIYSGRIMGTFPHGQTDKETIGLLMAGKTI